MNELTVNVRLEDLRKQYALNLPEKVRKVTDSIRAFLAVPRDRVLLELAHRVVHSLTGSSGTYGFDELSRTARGAERVLSESLEGGTPPSSERQHQLREMIFSLGSQAVEAAATGVACETQ